MRVLTWVPESVEQQLVVAELCKEAERDPEEDRLSGTDAEVEGVTLGEGVCEAQCEALDVTETLTVPEPGGELEGVLDVLRDRLPEILCVPECVALPKPLVETVLCREAERDPVEDRLTDTDAQLERVTLGEGDCEVQCEALGVKETLPEPEPRGEVEGVLDVLRDRLPVTLCETDCVTLLKGEEVAHSLVVKVVVSDARPVADAEGEAVAAACREGLATQGEYVLRRV